MALPTATDLNTMDYAFAGSPFVSVESKANQNTNTLDYAFQAQPFVGAPQPAVSTYNTTQFFMVF